MTETLESLSKLITELNTTNSSNMKKEILKKYPECKEILSYIYSPYKKFGITSKNCIKNPDLIIKNIHFHIYDLLEDLSLRKLTGHTAISTVNGFVSEHKEYKDLIFKIIDKNLKTRLDSKSINKVWPDTIPEFSVALAEDYKKFKDKISFEKEKWLASRKLDGIRCLALVDNGDVTFFSRQGHEFTTLDNLKKEILENFQQMRFVLDGEICLIDEYGNENFRNILKELRKKDFTIENPRYKVFDFLSIEDFESKKSKYNLTKRYELVECLFSNGFKYMDLVTQTKVKSKEHLKELNQEAIDKGWEGLILRKDAPYKGKRSNDLLKVKEVYDAEFTVKKVEMGPIRIINKETGLEEEIEMLTNVFIEYKGCEVSVGSGFTFEERKKFYEDPSLILNKVITVLYTAESENQDGGYSLRFPRFKGLHGEERDT